MAGYEAAISETGDAHMSGVPHGEMTLERYAGTETGDAQVCGLSGQETDSPLEGSLTAGGAGREDGKIAI